ncbi:sensor histidine kinase [Herbiconiux sp. A18JL235]|uniref:Sensor histidine kinase n=1 Tax=Herbiconiux sp. A18JL235 TaxID=3152363 RepID=A0AB39BJQ4_9MICO
MTLQIAADVDGVVTSRALARAGVWLSSVFLAATVVLTALFIPITGRWELSLAIVGLLVTAAGVIAALLTRSFVRALVYTIAGCAGLYVYALLATGVTVSLSPHPPSSDYVLLSMPELAVLVVGVAARSLAKSIVLGSVAFVAGPGFVQLAAWQQGMTLAVDVPVVAAYVALGLLVSALWLGRRDAARGTVMMSDAALAEERDVAMGRFTARASTWLHDTVLVDLRALADGSPGPIPPEQMQAIDRDLANLADVRVILEGQRPAGSLRKLAKVPLLVGLVRAAEQKGLAVRVTGDIDAVNALSVSVGRAVERAVAECLDNVTAHSGVVEAEIAVMSSPPELSIMVSDAGVGFDVDAADDHTVGLRMTVVDTIVEVGGSVQIWSRPGAGTAVFVTVPGGAA